VNGFGNLDPMEGSQVGIILGLLGLGTTAATVIWARNKTFLWTVMVLSFGAASAVVGFTYLPDDLLTKPELWRIGWRHGLVFTLVAISIVAVLGAKGEFPKGDRPFLVVATFSCFFSLQIGIYWFALLLVGIVRFVWSLD